MPRIDTAPARSEPGPATAVAGQQPAPTLDARSRRTRAALCAALLDLLDERPLEQVTIREITQRAGVGYASFFRHHANKDALIDDIVRSEVAELLAHAAPAFQATHTYAAALAFCGHVAGNARLWSTLLTGGAAGMVREEIARQAGELRSTASFPSWLPTELAVIHGVSSTVEIVAWWLPRRDTYTVADVATILDRLVIAPAARRHG